MLQQLYTATATEYIMLEKQEKHAKKKGFACQRRAHGTSQKKASPAPPVPLGLLLTKTLTEKQPTNATQRPPDKSLRKSQASRYKQCEAFNLRKPVLVSTVHTFARETCSDETPHQQNASQHSYTDCIIIYLIISKFLIHWQQKNSGYLVISYRNYIPGTSYWQIKGE